MNLLLQLAYSNLWIALAASGQAWCTCKMLGLPAAAHVFSLPFLSLFGVYTFAKTVRFDPQADALNDPERTAFLHRWRIPLILAAAMGLVEGTRVSAGFGAGALILFWFPLLTAVLYDVKFMPAHWRYRRLKDITGVKSLVVGLTWATVGTFVPLLSCHRPDWGPLTVIFLYHGLNWFINTVYFDLGDMEGDRLEGVVTIPLWLGYSGTIRLLSALNGLALLLLCHSIKLGWLTPASSGLVALQIFVWGCLWAARRQGRDLGFLCDVLMDGTYVFAALFLALL